MAKETYIVVHPFREYYAELELNQVELTEFVPWAELTVEQRAGVLASQAAYDYMLTNEQFVHEAGIPEEWAEYLGTGDFEFGELEPMGLGKLSDRAAEGNRNYTECMNPVFRRIAKAA